jgi:hypothetical protein
MGHGPCAVHTAHTALFTRRAARHSAAQRAFSTVQPVGRRDGPHSRPPSQLSPVLSVSVGCVCPSRWLASAIFLPSTIVVRCCAACPLCCCAASAVNGRAASAHGIRCAVCRRRFSWFCTCFSVCIVCVVLRRFCTGAPLFLSFSLSLFLSFALSLCLSVKLTAVTALLCPLCVCSSWPSPARPPAPPLRLSSVSFVVSVFLCFFFVCCC